MSMRDLLFRRCSVALGVNVTELKMSNFVHVDVNELMNNLSMLRLNAALLWLL